MAGEDEGDELIDSLLEQDLLDQVEDQPLAEDDATAKTAPQLRPPVRPPPLLANHPKRTNRWRQEEEDENTQQGGGW